MTPTDTCIALLWVGILIGVLLGIAAARTLIWPPTRPEPARGKRDAQ